jgi:hypothetical protein
MSGSSFFGPTLPTAPQIAGARRRTRRDRRDHASRTRLEQRVLAEFREMPCMRLTAAQAERLFGMRGDVTERVIETLLHDGVLRVDDEGRYAAADLP